MPPETNPGLRPYRRADRDRLVELLGDRSVARLFTEPLPDPYTRASAEAWLNKVLGQEPPLNFVIELNGEMIGAAGLEPLAGPGRRAVIGLWLGRSFWGRGLASQAAGLLIGHAFQNLGLDELEARVHRLNAASQRVLAKNLFRPREGFPRPDKPDVLVMVRSNPDRA